MGWHLDLEIDLDTEIDLDLNLDLGLSEIRKGGHRSEGVTRPSRTAPVLVGRIRQEIMYFKSDYSKWVNNRPVSNKAAG